MELADFFQPVPITDQINNNQADSANRSDVKATPWAAKNESESAPEDSDRLLDPANMTNQSAAAESSALDRLDSRLDSDSEPEPEPELTAKTDREVMVNRAISVAIAASTAMGTFYALPAPVTGAGYSYYVEDVQELLASRGFYDGSIDGVQGRMTVDAIIQAQQFYGLNIDGVAGANTIAALRSDDYRIGLSSTNLPPSPVCNNICTSATVAEVQTLLQERGFYGGAIDGIEGSQTVAAIRQAQQFYGVAIDGIVGPVTMAALESGTTAIITPGYSVTQVQTLLQQRGFYNGAIDGVAGSLTKNAIIQAQQFYGLVVDGIAGPATIAALQGTATNPPSQPINNNPIQGTNITASQLQNLLQQRGFYNGPIDGVIGSLTTDAIRRAQQSYGLVVDGVAGSATIAALQNNNNNSGQNPNQPVPLPGGVTVAQLQSLLQQRGFYTGPIDGVVGSATTAAIISAQRTYGLPASGVADEATINALRANDRPVANPVDVDVVALQRLLTQRGFYTGPIDGTYGTATRAAVVAAQKFYRLPDDGVAGPSTIAALENDAAPTPTPTPTTPTPINNLEALQQLLTQRGFYNGPIDGQQGTETTTAIIRAKNFYGLQPADGMPTQALRDQLLQDTFNAES
ncbi:Peptidoglycan-binding domain 1 protein [Thalassoporum mexicanum PCC 7367]|uniref:peptidoglycan-binding domain-containing protein n=1 Tax=Thalassoporum mexicanum TaxID=3457544 RepID=UPI00029FDADC|nr:peptidoglycan-binding protein [Pseudanabaena sp. PCC 7367]AFY69730.1 Peptidoglycan-binding domain 1 protein [Pseudanabaena sp. PCC 7367]